MVVPKYLTDLDEGIGILLSETSGRIKNEDSVYRFCLVYLDSLFFILDSHS